MDNKIKEYTVNKSNILIQSRYELSTNEQRLILILASLVQPTDEDFKEYEFSINEFSKIMNFKGNSSYSEMAKLTKELMSKTFEIETDKSTIQINWLSSCEYVKGSGKVLMEFSPKLKPYLLKLKGNFTSYKLSNILSMKSKYSIRLYEILRSNLYKGSCTFTPDELRYMLKAEKYSQWSNLRQRVLESAEDEINKKTDISISHDYIFDGNKCVNVSFTIESSSAVEAKLYRTFDDDTDLKYYEKSVKK